MSTASVVECIVDNPSKICDEYCDFGYYNYYETETCYSVIIRTNT